MKNEELIARDEARKKPIEAGDRVYILPLKKRGIVHEIFFHEQLGNVYIVIIEEDGRIIGKVNEFLEEKDLIRLPLDY